LAALFDPDPEQPPYAGVGPIQRRVIFKNRRRGNTFDHSQALKITDEVLRFWGRQGGAKDDAIAAVADKYGLNHRTIEKALRLTRPKFKRLEEAIRRNLRPKPKRVRRYRSALK
jgi:hypothetical protein